MRPSNARTRAPNEAAIWKIAENGPSGQLGQVPWQIFYAAASQRNS